MPIDREEPEPVVELSRVVEQVLSLRFPGIDAGAGFAGEFRFAITLDQWLSLSGPEDVKNGHYGVDGTEVESEQFLGIPVHLDVRVD